MSEPTSTKLALSPGQRQTAQRQQIVEALEKAQGPLTAMQIFELARRDVREVGLATVYRTLKMLQDAALIRPVILSDGLARFEKTGRGPHHFRCRSCDGIWTLESGAVETFRNSHLRDGFVVEDDEIIFYGHCSNCNPALSARR